MTQVGECRLAECAEAAVFPKKKPGYCSRSHYQLCRWRKQREDRHCGVCGAEVYGRTRYYCGGCSDLARDLRSTKAVLDRRRRLLEEIEARWDDLQREVAVRKQTAARRTDCARRA